MIQTTGELLLDSPNSRIVDRFEDVNAITSETKRLARLVDNLMELSLGDAGRSSLDASAVNLDALVREACAAYEDFATLQDKRLEVETGSRETIEADADKLRQLLGIVLDNALKYTAPGDEITVRTRASGPKQCVVEVADTGCGIDPEDRARIRAVLSRRQGPLARDGRLRAGALARATHRGSTRRLHRPRTQRTARHGRRRHAARKRV